MGTRSATLTVESDDPAGSKVLPLSGIGTSPQASLDAGALDFGEQEMGANTRLALTLTNTGIGSLNILQLRFVGGAPGDFSLTASTCSATLAEGASCTVEIAFRPTAVGARSTSLEVVTDAPSSPDLVALTGAGLEGEPGGGEVCIER